MDRIYKGCRVNGHADDYCIVDLETTGIFVRTAKIIEISAVRVRDNQITDHFSRLVNPGCPIPPEASAVNHISDEMVKDCPCLDGVIDSFTDFVGEDVIVGYNNAGFDMNLLYDAMMVLRGKPFSNNYIDVLHAARRCLPVLEDHRLETICNYYLLDTAGEHRALKDCYLTKSVYDSLYRDFGEAAFEKRSGGGGRDHAARFSAETLALQELQELLESIIGDGGITETEVSALKAWMESRRDLQGTYPFDRVFHALDRALKDGKVLPEELDDLENLLWDLTDPVRKRGSHKKIETVRGRHIAVTGDFVYGSREDVRALIEAAGGINDKGVKKATDYLVVGEKGSSRWKTGRYGSKILKAIELKDQGLPVEIVEEGEFIPALKCMVLGEGGRNE